jgi:hypothetical protein
VTKRKKPVTPEMERCASMLADAIVDELAKLPSIESASRMVAFEQSVNRIIESHREPARGRSSGLRELQACQVHARGRR